MDALTNYKGKEVEYRPLYNSEMRRSTVFEQYSRYDYRGQESVFLVMANNEIVPLEGVFFLSPIVAASA